MSFQDICCYSRWIIADKERMCRHLPERVLRQYGYIHTIPRPPTTIGDLEPEDMIIVFWDFVVHVLSQAERGQVVAEDKLWKYVRGYIISFYRVSLPIMSNLASVADYTTRVPPYKEVIVEQLWARQVPDPLQIIENIKRIVDSAMEFPNVFSNLLVVGIMEGIRSEYSMLQEESVPQMRTMNSPLE